MAPVATTALAAIAVTVLAAAATTSVAAPARGGTDVTSTARLVAGLTDAKVITLADDCGGDCQASVSDALTARGCVSVRMLPTLRMATAVCAKTDGAATESVNAETARIPGVLDVEDDSLVTGAQVDNEDREGDRTFWRGVADDVGV